MNYPDEYEYNQTTMTAMENAIVNFFGTDGNISLTFYKRNNPKNFEDKIDGNLIIVTDKSRKLNIQIKRSKTHKNTFSIGGTTLRDYLKSDYNVQALLIGLAYRENMYLFYWKEFLEYAEENYNFWKSDNGDYYIVDIDDLLSNIYSQEIPYTIEDYTKLLKSWNK